MYLTPLQLYILLHLKKANVEYVKMIMKMTEIDMEKIQDAINSLMELGLVERDSGSAIKRTKARFKRASEVHKHHSYYKLSRDGSLFVRNIDEKFMSNYFDSQLGTNGFQFIKILASSKNFKDACRKYSNTSINCEKFMKSLHAWGFLTNTGKKTKLFILFVRFAEI